MSIYTEADKAIIKYATLRTNDVLMAHAFAYGTVLSVLTDEQLEYLKKMADKKIQEITESQS